MSSQTYDSFQEKLEGISRDSLRMVQIEGAVRSIQCRCSVHISFSQALLHTIGRLYYYYWLICFPVVSFRERPNLLDYQFTLHEDYIFGPHCQYSC